MEKPQSDLDRDRQYCELCGKMENLLKCGRCRISFYCSKEHQKQHWKKHKLICKEADKAQISKQKPEQTPPSGDEKAPDTYREKKSPEQAAGASGTQNTNSVAPGVGDRPGEDGSSNSATSNGQTNSSPQKLATECVVPCMSKHGICVVDNFLGAEIGQGILDNVKALHKTGRFTDGQLVSQKSDSSKDIRGDKITWIEGKEAGCEKIRFLMSRMDDLIRHCNGKLGNYTINGRTKQATESNTAGNFPHLLPQLTWQALTWTMTSENQHNLHRWKFASVSGSKGCNTILGCCSQRDMFVSLALQRIKHLLMPLSGNI
ncbi:egl nine homolog 1 isoform X3 [Mastacembelus armatus]|uniref:egl nine homolog 1 isoform X3 n=1 Tax=Mastacembelus armatus TaxID=205130 RepID=UPI000E4595C1|nr:egl nine homolog 1 isoform X3 [Mastacembelus armatus]XP_026164552.1 egl nine homolog 1 isoform X3 [Mastacembelus armatus]